MEYKASPVRFEVDYPESSSRWLALAGILYIVKFLIMLPVFVVVYLIQIAFLVVVIIGWFAVLFTGKYPRGLFDFNVQVMKWMAEINVYFFSMSDRYPPFFPK